MIISHTDQKHQWIFIGKVNFWLQAVLWLSGTFLKVHSGHKYYWVFATRWQWFQFRYCSKNFIFGTTPQLPNCEPSALAPSSPINSCRKKVYRGFLKQTLSFGFVSIVQTCSAAAAVQLLIDSHCAEAPKKGLPISILERNKVWTWILLSRLQLQVTKWHWIAK